MTPKKNRPAKPPSEEPVKYAMKPAHFNLIGIGFLVLLCVIVYYNSLSNGFVYDDFGSIVENRYIKQPAKYISGLFNHSYFNIAGIEASYRPVSTLSYLLIYSVAELNPFYYHLASVLLHILNAVLVYGLANIIFKDRLKALIAGGLFASHPVLTEAVNCISFNEDLLTTFFFMLAFLVYTRIKSGQLKSNIGIYGLSLLFYFLGLLSKEMAITLPVVIVLYDWIMRGDGMGTTGFGHLLKMLKNRASIYSGFFVVSMCYLFLRFFIFQNPAESSKSSFGGLFERIIYLPHHLFSFIRLMVFPAELNADYVFSYPETFFSSENLVGFAIFMGLVALSFFIYRYSKAAFFGLWWCLITLFPVSNLIEIFHPFAERYLYLPLIGFCFVVPVLVFGLVGKLIIRAPIVNQVSSILILGIVAIYATTTISRNQDWQNNYSLWSKTIQTSPDSLVANAGLGMVYMERGRLKEARALFEKVIKLYPGHHKAYYNLGLVYHRKGDLERSMEYFKRSVTLEPEFVRGHYNLATLYARQGKMDPAIRHYTRVIELDPDVAEAHYNLGMAYAVQKRLPDAISQWEIVLQLDPRHTAARTNLAKARMMMKSSGAPKTN